MKIAIGSSSFGATDPRPIEVLEEVGLDVAINPFGRRLEEQEITATVSQVLLQIW